MSDCVSALVKSMHTTWLKSFARGNVTTGRNAGRLNFLQIEQVSEHSSINFKNSSSLKSLLLFTNCSNFSLEG